MAKTITFRADDDALRALQLLTADGASTSDALRDALLTTARQRAAERLRGEAVALALDEADRAEAAQVLEDMAALRAW